MVNMETDDLEFNILKNFYNLVKSERVLDCSISDSKIVRDTKNQLKAALKGVSKRCTCSRRTWGGPCEVCQASSKELYYLRNFFRFIRDAKKYKMTPTKIEDFVNNMQSWIG